MLAALAPAAVQGFPDGAPWGTADPAAPETCATCHFDYDAVPDAREITIEGLPRAVVAGKTYRLLIRFAQADALTAGFQLLAVADGGGGVFKGYSGDVECAGPAARSIVPMAAGDAEWILDWTAPGGPPRPIVFYVAVVAANDDGSPFGDTPHFRSFTLRP